MNKSEGMKQQENHDNTMCKRNEVVIKTNQRAQISYMRDGRQGKRYVIMDSHSKVRNIERGIRKQFDINSFFVDSLVENRMCW
jgi:hypothetical protein